MIPRFYQSTWFSEFENVRFCWEYRNRDTIIPLIRLQINEAILEYNFQYIHEKGTSHRGKCTYMWDY